MRLTPLFFALFFILAMLTNIGYSQDMNCNIMHNGTFNYGGAQGDVKVVIKGLSHIEFHNKGKHMIKSKIEWVNNCEFNLTVQKVTLPDFPYKVGEVMHVKVNGILGNEINYTATVKDKSWGRVLIKN